MPSVSQSVDARAVLGLGRRPWPGKGYATFGGGDFSAALTERGDIYDLVREAGVDGFVTVRAIVTASGQATQQRHCRQPGSTP